MLYVVYGVRKEVVLQEILNSAIDEPEDLDAIAKG